MFTLSTVIVVAVIALVIGVIIGGVLTRLLSPQEQKARSLENQLSDAEQQLKKYQQQVTEHFAQTAKLVNNLTQSYKDVHEHLAGDALKLANVDISRQLLRDNSDDKQGDNTKLSEENFQPPRDWAPKSPGQAGPLSEDYGLGDDDEPYSRKTVKPRA